MLLESPVDGIIHPTTWKRPAGNHEPRLVRGFSSVHDGIDISTGDYGRPIYACGSGEVNWASKFPDGALAVAIMHAGPWRTLYGHLLDERVSVGQHVDSRERIAHLGYSGHTVPEGPDGAHLHLELFDDNARRYDPWPRLYQNVRVRLLASTPDGVNLRTAPTLDDASHYAVTKNGRIVRNGVDLGDMTAWRAWGRDVAGDRYTVGDVTSDRWRKIKVAGRFLYVAVPFTQLSAA